MTSPEVTYEFGDVRVDAASELVSRSGTRVLLEPKAFELLVYFIQHRGRLLEKQDILDAIWGETFVSENALTRVVAQLRRALGDDAHGSKYIETVPRRGYRLVADVRVVVSDEHTPRGKKPLLIAVAVCSVLAGVATLVMLSRPRREDLSWTERPVQLTSSTALDIFPTMSPDGNAVAYSSNRSGSFEIYVKQLTPTAKEIELTSDGSQNFQPAWSPKGDLIAYYSKGHGGIWIVPAFGGAPRKLTEFGSRPTWSPDGQRVAFQSEPLRDLGTNAATLPPSTIWICALDGGPPQPLTRDGSPPGGHGNPAWSPNGDHIAFIASDINLSKLWTVSLEGELAQVPNAGFSPESGWAQRLYDVVYLPTGDELYFTGHGTDFYGVWSASLTSSTGESSEPRLVKKSVSPAIRYLGFSAGGRKLVYAGVVTSSNVASVSLSTETYEPTEPPRLLTHHTNWRNYVPRFSPDGRTIAFERYVTGQASDVWLVDADGGTERRLTTHPMPDSAPRWSADGRRVIFLSSHEGRFGFWSIDLVSREVEFLHPVSPHWGFPALSPGTTRVAFNSAKNGGVVNLWVASLSDDEERQLTFDDEMMGFASWSPDGELLTFQMTRGNDTHVGVIPVDGGAPVQLTHEPGHDQGAGAWSPDGDKIAFASWRDGAWNLRWVSRIDQREAMLTDYTSLNTFVRFPAWSPLGNQIVYEYAETTGDIWMLELPRDYQR
jgi:Tol biopolymer transport system component/DNA-binding winged helix-turn-helix (wHTH) protein